MVTLIFNGPRVVSPPIKSTPNLSAQAKNPRENSPSQLLVTTPSPQPSPIKGEGVKSAAPNAPSPLEGEGWGEGEVFSWLMLGKAIAKVAHLACAPIAAMSETFTASAFQPIS